MKRLIFVLSTVIIMFTSCAVFYGPNMEQRAQQLELGMSKQDAINIMGNDYYIESSFQAPEGNVLILHFRSTYYSEYLLYFLNNELTEFHKYIPPRPDVHILKEEKKAD